MENRLEAILVPNYGYNSRKLLDMNGRNEIIEPLSIK